MQKCDFCGELANHKLDKRCKHIFCSKNCLYNYRVSRGTWKPKEQRVCKYCNKEFLEYAAHINFGDGIFCSMECKANWQRENLQGVNHPNWKGGKVERKCLICGTIFNVKPKDLKQKGGGRFCSRKCLGEARRLEKLRQWQDPEYRDRTIAASLRGLFKRPTSLEEQFIKLIEKYDLPYQYTGDGSFLIGYKNPDFVNINGAKICIEVAEPYFHDDNYTKERVSHFAKYGWICYVFLAEDGKLNRLEILRNLNEELSKKGIEV